MSERRAIAAGVAERHVKIAAKLYECRTAARTLLGDRYQKAMEAWKALVIAVAKRDGSDNLQAAMKIASNHDLDGNAQMLVLAAAVELIEPSEVR